MDDKFIDLLITRATHSRNRDIMPTEDFFAAIASQETKRRRQRSFLRISVAACIGAVLTGASCLMLSQSHTETTSSYSAKVESAIYSESIDNIAERMEQFANSSKDIRNSIEQQSPF